MVQNKIFLINYPMRFFRKDTVTEKQYPEFVHEVVRQIGRSYGQYQEDLIIDTLLGQPEKGFYIDIGGNHPILNSNTYRFYLRGWNGVIIEPNIDLYSEYGKVRPNDIALNIGVGAEEGILDFYVLAGNGLCSFSKENAYHNAKHHRSRITEVRKTQIRPFISILEEYVHDKEISFISLDIEGNEMSVLTNNDWERFRPKLWIIEINIGGKQLVQYLEKKDYPLVFSNGTNGLFVDKRRKEFNPLFK